MPIGELKTFQNGIKKDYQLALDLYDAGNYDAMYLADVVAAGSPHGHELALEWIESAQPLVTSAGWATLSSVVACRDDAELDLPGLKRLLQRVGRTIHQAPDAVRYGMNSFIIAVGSYVKSLTDFAIQIGEKIGSVTADLGGNNCQVFFAPDYIRKVQQRGSIGKKRRAVKC